jgi:hypothetical protein
MLFNDNGSIVKRSGLMPHSPLKKQHHALSYHYTWEAVASNAVDFQFIPGHLNPADILSKHWGYQQVWASALRPILVWKGNTSELFLDINQPKPRKSQEIMEEIAVPWIRPWQHEGERQVFGNHEQMTRDWMRS